MNVTDMKVAACLIACAAWCYSDSSLADEAKSNTEQLMQTQVGKTHIPHTVEPKPVNNPYQNDSRAITQGRALFIAMNCVGCHAPEGGGGMGPPLSDDLWIYGSEPAQIYLTILQGRPNGMPAFGKALPADAIWQLVSYVRSLSHLPVKPAEAEAAENHSGKQK